MVNQAKKKCLIVGEPTQNRSITTVIIMVKHDEMLEPNLYLDTYQQEKYTCGDKRSGLKLMRGFKTW